jgi:hypothetical protein
MRIHVDAHVRADGKNPSVGKTESADKRGRGRTSGRKGRPDVNFHPKTSVMTILVQTLYNNNSRITTPVVAGRQLTTFRSMNDYRVVYHNCGAIIDNCTKTLYTAQNSNNGDVNKRMMNQK